MPVLEKEIMIKNSQGLHARPAAMFIQIASKYHSKVTIQKGREKVDGRSIMGILTLGAQKNSKVILTAEGDDAPAVMAELEQLLTSEQNS